MIESNNTTHPESKELSTVDFVLLFIVVLLPVVCNLAYTIYRFITKKNTGRRVAVNTIPVALSLTASYLSANTIMGVPAIMINQGLTYWFLILAFPLSMAIVAHLILPVTYNADLPDIYKVSNGKHFFLSSFAIYSCVMFFEYIATLKFCASKFIVKYLCHIFLTSLKCYTLLHFKSGVLY